MKPEITAAELAELLDADARGEDIPHLDSATQVDCWREERQPEAG